MAKEDEKGIGSVIGVDGRKKYNTGGARERRGGRGRWDGQEARPMTCGA